MQAANEAALAELRGVQERLSTSERCVETLRTEIRDMVAQRDNGQADLHQARLQAAQVTLQLADANLALREARASWVQERESLQCSTEVTDVTNDNDREVRVGDKQTNRICRQGVGVGVYVLNLTKNVTLCK